jgi:acyl-coenzyme A thioesterase 13
MHNIPEGFKPLFRTSPFLDHLGEYFYRGWGGKLIVGCYIDETSANGRGIAHAGFLTTLADVTLGYAVATSQEPAITDLLTTHLSIDFAGSAKIGDWVEARVDIQKVGRQNAYANAYLSVNEERIVRVSAIFSRKL